MSKLNIPDEEKVNLVQFKRHQRKFPWALIIRIIVALITIGLILYISEEMLSKSNIPNNEDFEIEIEYR